MYTTKLLMFLYVLVIHNKGGQAYLLTFWQHFWLAACQLFWPVCLRAFGLTF
jgi:hypothetical protein